MLNDDAQGSLAQFPVNLAWSGIAARFYATHTVAAIFNPLYETYFIPFDGVGVAVAKKEEQG